MVCDKVVHTWLARTLLPGAVLRRGAFLIRGLAASPSEGALPWIGNMALRPPVTFLSLSATWQCRKPILLHTMLVSKALAAWQQPWAEHPIVAAGS